MLSSIAQIQPQTRAAVHKLENHNPPGESEMVYCPSRRVVQEWLLQKRHRDCSAARTFYRIWRTPEAFMRVLKAHSNLCVILCMVAQICNNVPGSLWCCDQCDTTRPAPPHPLLQHHSHHYLQDFQLLWRSLGIFELANKECSKTVAMLPQHILNI